MNIPCFLLRSSVFWLEISLVSAGWFSLPWNVVSYRNNWTPRMPPTGHVSLWRIVNQRQVLVQRRKNHEAKTATELKSFLIFAGAFSSEFWWGTITYEQFHECLNFIPFKLFWWSFFSLFPIRKIISHISEGGLLVYCSNRHMMIVHSLWTFYINTFVVSLSIKTFSSK